MFFQKNISGDLELGRGLKISRTTCLILSNLQHFYFILHSSSFYYNLHWSCALTICLSYHYIYLNIVFNLFEKSYTHSLICKTQRERREKKKTKRTKWRSTQRCVLQICHWAFGMLTTSWGYIDRCSRQRRSRRSERSEDQLNAMFFRSVIEHSIRWLHHRSTSINVVDSLISHSVNSDSNDLWRCFWHDSILRRSSKLWQ